MSLDAVREVNRCLDAQAVLRLLDCLPDEVTVAGGILVARCPLHPASTDLTLTVEMPENTFRCEAGGCMAAAGGAVVELLAWARGISPPVAAAELAHQFSLSLEEEVRHSLASSLVEEASQRLSSGSMEDAEAALACALRLEPESAAAHLLAGKLLDRSGQTEPAGEEYLTAADLLITRGEHKEATRALEQAGRLLSDSEDVLLARARLFELQGDVESAAENLAQVAELREQAGRQADNLGILRRLVEIRPDDPHLRLRLAQLHEGRRDMRTAAREIEKAAELFTAAGQGAEAVPLLEKVLRLEPQMNRMRLALVDRLVEAGQPDRARAHLFDAVAHQMENSEYVAAAQSVRRWLEFEPTSVDGHEWLARIYQEQEMNAEAGAELLAAARLCDKAGDSERALSYLFRAKFIHPEDETLREEIVRMLLARSETSRALAELLDLAEVRFERQARAEALAALEQAAAADLSFQARSHIAAVLISRDCTDEAVALLAGTAEAARERKDDAEALQCWEAVVELRPRDIGARRQLLSLLEALSDFPRALLHSAELAALLLEEGHREEALELVRATVARMENAGETAGGAAVAGATSLIRLCGRMEEASEAARAFSAAEKWLPRAAPLEAFDCTAALLEILPEHEQALRAAGTLAGEAGRPTEGTEALVRLATLQEGRGEFEEAAADLARAAQLAPDQPQLLERRARLLERAGAETALQAWHGYLAALRGIVSAEEALQACEEFLTSHPSDPVAERGRAELLAETGRPDEAEALLQQLLSRALEAGDPAEAVRLHEGLVALAPQDPMRRVALGGALVQAGESRRAGAEFVRASRDFLSAGALDRALLAAGKALELQEDCVEALEVLTSAERQGGQIPSLEHNLARLAALRAARAENEAALAAWAELAHLRAADPQPRRQMALLQEQENNPAAAVQSWLQAAQLHARAGEVSEALEIFRDIQAALSGDIASLEAWADLAQRHGPLSDQSAALLALTEACLAACNWPGARAALERLGNAAPQAPQLAPLLQRLAEGEGTGPDACRDWMAAAEAWKRAGDDHHAGLCLNRAVDTEPDNPHALEQLALHYEHLQQEETALRVRLALLRARIARAEGEQWRADLQELRKRADQVPGARLALARILLGGGHRDEALQDLEHVARHAAAGSDHASVLEVCDTDPRVTAASQYLRGLKADSLLALERFDAAVAWLRQCAESALHEGNPDEAQYYTKRWSQLVPADPHALGVMADIHVQRQQPELAYEMSLAQANFFWARGDYPGAMTALRRALEVNPEGFDALRILGQVELESGHEEKAIEHMQVLADHLLAVGNEREAYEVLRDVLRISPRAVRPLRSMARLIYRYRGFPKALPAYRRLLSGLRDQGRVEEALAEYEEALGLEDAPYELRLEYADYLELLGRHREAKRQYLEAGRYVRDVIGDFAQAARLLSQAAAEPLDPEDAEALEELGVLRRIGRMAGQAATAFREAARLHERRQYPERALECLQQALDLAPAAAPAGDLADLARLLLLSGRREEAITACRRAVEQACDPTGERLPQQQLLLLRRQLKELDPLDTANALELISLLAPGEAAKEAVEMGRSFRAAGFAGEQMKLLTRALERDPDNLALRAEVVSTLRHGQNSEPLRQALADLCRTAARLEHKEIARAALEQIRALPSTEGTAFLTAPLYAMCGERHRAVEAYVAAVHEMLEEGDTGGACAAAEAALALDSPAVPASVLAILVRQAVGSSAVRALALRALDEALIQQNRARSAVLGSALLETLVPQEIAVLIRHMTERGGAPLASLICAVHADWLLTRNEGSRACSLARMLTTAAPTSPDAWKTASQILEQAHQNDEAAEADAKASSLAGIEIIPMDEGELTDTDEGDDNNETVLESLASFYEVEHRVKDALRARRRQAELAAARGDRALAAWWLQRALALAPAEPGLREELADHLVAADRSMEAAIQFRELAQLHLRRSDTESARTAAEHALELDPTDEKAAVLLLELAEAAHEPDLIARHTAGLARVYIRSGRADEAYRFLTLALERNPQHPELRRALAACTKDVTSADFHTAGEDIASGTAQPAAPGENVRNSAIAQFELLLSLQPDDLDVLEILVNTCGAEGLMDKQAEYAMRLLEEASRRGDYDRAFETGNALLERSPDLVAVRRVLAALHQSRGENQQAARHWMRAADTLAAQGDKTGAAECLRQVTELESHNVAAWKKQGELLSAAGDAEGARRAYEHVTESFRTPSEIRYADTTIRRLKSLDLEDPIAHERAYALERRAGRKGSAMEELVWLVGYHLQQGNLDAAEKMLREGEELDSDSLSLLECRAELLRMRQSTDELRAVLKTVIRRATEIGHHQLASEALAELRQLLSSDTDGLDRLELGEILLSAGDEENAYAEFCGAVKADLAQGDPSAARATAEAVLRRHPGIPKLYAALAAPFVSAGRTDIAVGYFSSAATLAVSVGDADSGEAFLRQALAVRPKWPEGLLQLGESCILSGDREGAMEAFQKVEALHVEEGRFGKAADAARRQVPLAPRDIALRERVAEHYEKEGDNIRAAEALDEAVELRMRRKDLAGALAVCRRLVALRPREPAPLRRYAELLEKVSSGPEVVEAYTRLAQTYASRGATVQAAEIYARVLGLDPGNTDARQRLMSLQK